MKGLPAALLAVLAAAILQAAPQRFSSGIEIVSVDALVVDGRRPVDGLTAADFELRDNGVLQRIESVGREQLPLRVALALDVSSSVEGERLRQLRTAALAVINTLRPADRASLFSFSHRFAQLMPLTSDRRLLAEAVSRLATGGATSLRDAAFAALALRETGAGRTLVVLFSDGVDTTSFLSEADVLRAVQRSDAVIYPVGVRTAIPQGPRWDARLAAINAEQEVRDTRFLRELAAATGGRLVMAEGDHDIGAAFARVLEEFNSRYVLTYAPAGVAATGWHRIEVKLAHKKGSVTARRGYLGNRS